MIGYLFYHDTRDIFIKRLMGIFLSLMGINFIVINGVKFITNIGVILLQGNGYYFYINDRVSFYSAHKG